MNFKYKGIIPQSAAVAIGIAALLSSCEDDFDYREKSLDLSFDIEIPSGWSNGMSIDKKNPATRCTSVDAMSCGEGVPLYLHTIVADNPTPSGHQVQGSRATPIKSKDEFINRYSYFSLSAICAYTEEDIENLPPNLAYNLKYNIDGGSPATSNDRIYMPNDGSVSFFAFAPSIDESRPDGSSTAAISLSDKSTPGMPKITYTVPTDIKKQFDLLTASSINAYASPVVLNFKHALTAICLKCGDDMMAGKITEVTISGIYGSGTHVPGTKEWTVTGNPNASYTINDEISLPSKNESSDGANKDKTHTQTGTPIAGTKSDNLTMMLIPQTLPESAKLTIKFVDDITKATRTIEGSLKGKTWEAGKIVTYTISPSSIHIEAKVEFSKDPGNANLPYSGVWYDTELKGYAEVTQGSNRNEIALTPQLQHSIDEGKTWVVSEYNSDGKYVISARQDDYVKLSKELKSGFVGSENSPHNLLEDTNGESANCYMIDQAGYYSLPLVYGNSKINNGENAASYTINRNPPEGETILEGLKYFVDHNNAQITNPKIEGCDNAVLAWQDAPDLVDKVEIKNGQLQFRIRETTLTQGNALIVVRDASKTILWSWHIWVTPYKDKWNKESNLFKTNCTIAGNTYEYLLTPCNLGYCDPHNGNEARKVKFRAVFDMSEYGGNATTIVEIGEFTQDEFKGSLAGDNTYYQWGRKDPMLPGIYNDNTICYKYHKYDKNSGTVSTAYDTSEFTMENKPFFNAYKDAEGRNYSPSRNPTDKDIRGVDLKYMIQNPYIMVMSDLCDTSEGGTEDFNYRGHWHVITGTNYIDKGGKMYNLWNSTAYNEGTNDLTSPKNAQKVTKTIYDPCPAGFCMPPLAAFIGLAKGSGVATGVTAIPLDHICKFTTSSSSGSIEFPISGMRNKSLRRCEISTVTSSHSDALIAEDFNKISFPAFKDVTFVSCANLGSGDQVLLFIIDTRNGNVKISSGTPSSNSYGLSVRPMSDK